MVGAVGGSAGASHALYCSTDAAAQQRLDCAVLLSGIYDFAEETSLCDAIFKTDVSTYCHILPDNQHFTEFLQHESPITFVESSTTVAPLLIFAAQDCATCSVQNCCPDSIRVTQFNNLTDLLDR